MKKSLGLLAAIAVLATIFSACDPVRTPQTPEEETESFTPPAIWTP